jgi:hypothetical protein
VQGVSDEELSLVRDKLERFVNASNFNLSLIFVGKSGTVFTKLNFILNLRIGPISYSVTLHNTKKAFQ